MKMYEEQELTMQVFSEPEILPIENDGIVRYHDNIEEMASLEKVL